MNKKYNALTDKCLNTISNSSPFLIIIFTSILVSFLSFTFVYFFSQRCTASLEDQLFRSSIIIPLITTPIIVAIMIRFSKHLKHYQEDIKIEIEKNKKKDLIMFEQSRFALMGEMLANISHQWKQPLNNVGLAVVSSRFSDSSIDREKYFDIIEDNINYLSNTIDDFMSFFDKKTIISTKTVSDIMDEVQSIMRSQLESNHIKLSIKIEDSLSTIELKSLLSQVIINLLNNAKDAIDDNKTDKLIIIDIEKRNNGLQIICSDNGIGIHETIVSKIFDPYFTTKEKKQGTGIGLYMSKQIITKIFDGTIKLDTKSIHTCFKIDIPVKS